MALNGAASEYRRRRRGAVLEGAVLRATWDELTEVGWAGLRIERVAARAGAGKQSIYDRWPNKVALAFAAMQRMARESDVRIASSGDLRTDLLAALDVVREALNGPMGQVVRGLAADVAVAADSGLGIGRLSRQPPRFILELLEEGRDLGLIAHRPIDPILANLGLDLASHHYLITGAPPDVTDCEAIVDTIWLPLLTR